ncbi:hypothetical protein KAZ82_00695 [Candidatus Babeliales bacterium]|nr:hypothetical protein [Candidatus Babeliales bacterium]
MNKNLFLSVILLTCTAVGYVPVTGPLCLSDVADASGNVLHRGEIMRTLQSTRSLHGCMQALCRFMKVESLDQLPTYQTIMEKLITLPYSTVDSDAAIQAIEYAIMYSYDQQIYIVGGYTQWVSCFISGLRWRALNPLSYFNPFSWFTENHEKGSQLLSEFEQLTDIADRINSRHYTRLRTTLFSYDHWRKIRLLPLAQLFVTVCRINSGL